MAVRNAAAASGLRRSGWARFKAGAARRFGWLWRPLLYAGILVGFLMGRALPGGEAAAIAPFGVAFCAAVYGAGLGASGATVAALSALAGSLSVLGLAGGVPAATALGACLVAGWLFRLGRKGASPLAAAVTASVASGAAALQVFGENHTVQMVFWVGLTGVLAQVFSLGLSEVLAGRLLRRGAADAPVPAIVILASALCGLRGVELWGWLSLRDVAASVVALVSAYSGGPPLGAAAGGVMGIGLLFGGLAGEAGDPLAPGGQGVVGVAALGMAYVVAGLLAGTFRLLRKPGVGLAFALGFTTLVMSLGSDMEGVVALSASGMAGVLLFWLIPRTALARIPDALVSTSDPPAEPEERRPRAPEAEVVERIRGMTRVLREVGRTFDQVAAVEVSQERSVSRVVEQVAERVCRSCSLQELCWEKHFHKTYQLLDDLWNRVNEEGPLTEGPLPEELRQACIFPDRMASTLDYLADLNRFHHHWERRLEEGRRVVSDYIKNVARLMDGLAEEAGSSGRRNRPHVQPVLQVTSGVARLPKRGGQVSGDSYEGAQIGPDRYMLALSDGMGVGAGAAMESRQCVRLLRELLESGFPTEVAVNTVNSALLLRSPAETFATVDLTLLDTGTGRAEFVKIGAAPSFVKRGSDVTVVKTASLPVGIINQIKVEPEYRSLRAGDLVVMITDGVWDVSKNDVDKERWLIDHLVRESATDPEEVAEGILARALELAPDTADDMTVLVARIDALSGGAPTSEPKRPRTGEWVPLRQAPRGQAKGTVLRLKRGE